MIGTKLKIGNQEGWLKLSTIEPLSFLPEVSISELEDRYRGPLDGKREILDDRADSEKWYDFSKSTTAKFIDYRN